MSVFIHCCFVIAKRLPVVLLTLQKYRHKCFLAFALKNNENYFRVIRNTHINQSDLARFYPLIPKIKIHIFLSTCYQTFLIQEVGRSCKNIKRIHVWLSSHSFYWPLRQIKQWHYNEKFDDDHFWDIGINPNFSPNINIRILLTIFLTILLIFLIFLVGRIWLKNQDIW